MLRQKTLRKISVQNSLLLAVLGFKRNNEVTPEKVFDEKLLLSQGSISEKLLHDAKEQLLKEYPVKKDEIEKAFEFIQSGKASRDVRSGVKENIKQNFATNIKSLFYPIKFFAKPISSLRKLIKGNISAASVLIAPDKESLRFVLILYARSDGIKIDDGDINAVYELLNSPDKSNFKQFVSEGVEYFKESYHYQDSEKAYKKFKILMQ